MELYEKRNYYVNLLERENSNYIRYTQSNKRFAVKYNNIVVERVAVVVSAKGVSFVIFVMRGIIQLLDRTTLIIYIVEH